MVTTKRCAYGTCRNDSRYPQSWKRNSNDDPVKFFHFPGAVKPSFHMIAMIPTIAAQGSQRSLRAYGNIHSVIFAIVATVIAEIEKFLSLRSLRSL